MAFSDQTVSPSDHQNNNHTDLMEPKPEKSDWQTRLKTAWTNTHNAISLVPLIAPLAAAGYYQADLAKTSFDWDWPWCLVFPLSIEAGAAWAAGNYHRKLVAGDSTVSARLGLLAYASTSAALLYWHARDTGRPLAAAWAIAAMTFAAVWIWIQRAKHAKRDLLRARGLVDQQVPRFSAARWFLCPIETARAFRWAVKYSQSDPARALADYRQTRLQTDQTVKSDHQTRPVQENRPQSDPVKTDQTRPSNQTGKPDRSKKTDRSLIQSIKNHFPDRIPTTKEIRLLADCGQSKAVRLQTLIKEAA